jgi:NAD(P)-dependent dehydrogenase (short-subunit alcohol dehydrogenase family)
MIKEVVSDSEIESFSLKGKTILITGAASGLGRAISIVSSKLGANLFLADKNSVGLNLTAEKCCNSCTLLEIDFLDTAGIQRWLTEVTSMYGRIHGIVHSAGISYISPLKSLDESQYLEVLRINTLAALELSKTFALRSVNSGNGGSIVFISSVYGLVGSSANVGYAMSKAALHGITRSLAIELASKKIRVNCVAPGFIKTPMDDKTAHFFNESRDLVLTKLHPLGLGEPADVAFLVTFLQSDASKWITGTIIPVDGGFTAQ